jgi:nitrite reductase (cytochrome c-552)
MSESPQTHESSPKQPPVWRGWALFVVALIGTFLLGMLGASILQRREEAKKQLPHEPIAALEMDAAKWGVAFPNEFDAYMEMKTDPQQPENGGPATGDYLKETPANVVLFAGYAFSKDYQKARGHWWAVKDVSKTERLSPATPATCWTCKSPEVPKTMLGLGNPDEEQPLLARMNPAAFYAKKFSDFKEGEKKFTHPIGCFDCHDPESMKLRITRPALAEALVKRGRDLDNIPHQEMRTLVCAQCHVEYYFQNQTAEKKDNYLAFPWEQGTSPEKMEEHYDAIPLYTGAAEKFYDWKHAISKAPMIKMQHPDYEVYSTGVHAYRKVACADCHMPYRTAGGMKFTNHHIQSPLRDIANSCAVCHRWSEAEIRTRVEGIQDKVREGRKAAETVLTEAHFDIAAAMQAGASDEELVGVRKLVRGAQLRWDYVAANNGLGFHSPQECMRVLAAAIARAGECRVECARILAAKGYSGPVAYPDFSSKEKAQALIAQFGEGKEPPKLLPEKKR